VYLSPLHGAALMAMTANHGLWRDPVLFERDVAHATTHPALDPTLADQLVDMLSQTVTHGTAQRIFHERGFQVDAVGKTGSLADKTPVFRDYSWFVGFAPKDHPRIAVAAIVVNDAWWRIRGTWLGREALRLFLERKGPPGTPEAKASSLVRLDGGAPERAGE
jgi:cell division protein FtsI/penicillin-binding protein 2